MQLKSFILPIADAVRHEEELNRFLRGHRILQVTRNFCSENGGYWAVLVEYMEGDASGEVEPISRNGKKKDVLEELTDAEKNVYYQLAEIRRKVAHEKDMPAYMIFSNAELAVLARQPNLSIELQKGIKGVSTKHLTDYLSYFISTVEDETGRILNGEDSAS